MAHNFRDLEGFIPNFYISKSGHDSNDGLTPDTPKRTLLNGSNHQQIGAGFYDISNNPTLDYAQGDGKVVLDAKSTPLGSGGYGIKNLEIRNTSGGGLYTSVQRPPDCENVIFKNCVFEIVGGNNRYIKTYRFQFIDSVILLDGTDSRISAHNHQAIFYNTEITLSRYGHFSDSHISRGSTLTISRNSYSISNSNIQCEITFGSIFFSDGISKTYALQDELVGTPQDNGYSPGVKWLNVANLTADGYTEDTIKIDNIVNTCINREPLFNNESIHDFTLQAGSPLIGRGGDGSNWGGTDLTISIINQDNGLGNVEVIPSPEIDTSNPVTYTLKVGEVEGYIDYIQKIGSSSVTLGKITPIASLAFDSDVTGGDLGNKDVPDSEPLTYDYPREFVTSSDANDSRTLVVAGHNAQINEWVRVNGEDREIISTTSSTITVGTNFRAPILTGSLIMVGSKAKIGALRPNRLTYLLRTSKRDERPTLLSHWDNDIDPLYNKTGHYLTQEWGTIPGYFIDSTINAVYGSGDSEAPQGLILNELSCKWINVRVYIRNNYKS